MLDNNGVSQLIFKYTSGSVIIMSSVQELIYPLVTINTA